MIKTPFVANDNKKQMLQIKITTFVVDENLKTFITDENKKHLLQMKRRNICYR